MAAKTAAKKAFDKRHKGVITKRTPALVKPAAKKPAAKRAPRAPKVYPTHQVGDWLKAPD